MHHSHAPARASVSKVLRHDSYESVITIFYLKADGKPFTFHFSFLRRPDLPLGQIALGKE